jgi:hypothetical protein
VKDLPRLASLIDGESMTMLLSTRDTNLGYLPSRLILAGQMDFQSALFLSLLKDSGLVSVLAIVGIRTLEGLSRGMTLIKSVSASCQPKYVAQLIVTFRLIFI